MLNLYFKVKLLKILKIMIEYTHFHKNLGYVNSLNFLNSLLLWLKYNQPNFAKKRKLKPEIFILTLSKPICENWEFRFWNSLLSLYSYVIQKCLFIVEEKSLLCSRENIVSKQTHGRKCSSLIVIKGMQVKTILK